ncbi:MAG: STAS domain-containing protein [Fibrobacterota bacterium]
MKEGKFLFTIFEKICVIKPVGNINYTISQEFDTFLRQVFTDSSIHSFIIDMRETEYIDSTNLGLLARIQEHSLSRLHTRVTIISTNPFITEILTNLGFDRIFDMITEAPSINDCMHEVPHEECCREKVAPIMLKAHRYLMSINEKNRQMFRNVVNYLEEESRSENHN